MITAPYQDAVSLNKLYWLGLICVVSIFLGYMLATNTSTLILVSLAAAWLCLLPYHAPLSICMAVATFSSALILPYFLGRPFVWEFAALLGWTGVVVKVFMRRYAPGSAEQIRKNKWLFISAFGYCLVLIVTMFYRGFGLRIFGGTQMGGRFYFQQLACAIFPFLFVICRPTQATLVRLFQVQCVLTLTYLVSDFVFSMAPQSLYFLLQFFELPGDAVGFQMKAGNFGIRRFQSLSFVSVGILAFLLCRFNLRSFFTRTGVLLLPLAFSVLVVGLFSGHRILLAILVPLFIFCGYSQRFFNIRHGIICVGVLTLLLGLTYTFARTFPLAVQRAVSCLPGIDTRTQARNDAMATLETRRILREVGINLAPQYFWIGRGFGQSANVDYSLGWDQTGIELHLAVGKFYNGIIGLMVNTGIFGTVCMLIFLGSGTILAWRIMHLIRVQGCNDTFGRVCSEIGRASCRERVLLGV